MSDVDLGALASPDEEGFIVQPSVDIFKDEETKTALMDYLSTEVDEVASDAGRTVRMSRNDIIKRQRLARPETETKDFPWENASNVSPPLALQKTNQVVTRILNKLTEKNPLIQYDAVDPYKEHAEAITRYIQKLVESPYGINFYSKLWTIVYEAVSLGTEFVKVPWTIERMQFNRKDGDGAEERVDRIIKSSPDVVHIPMEDFLTRPHWTDIQKSPWIGVRYYKFRHELEALAAQGYYSNVELIITETAKYDIHKEEEKRLLGVESGGEGHERSDIFEVFECNIFWDADGDGIAEDIIVHFEKNTKTILRAEFNTLGIRDYRRLPHIDIPGSLYGLGVGDIMIPLQDEAEALHNMRNDAAQMSILPLIVTSTSSSFGTKQEIYPGKIIKTPSPKEDLIVHSFNAIDAPAMRAEQIVNQYADDATGASSALSGQDVGGQNRIGATGTQFLASQSTGYLDSIAQQMEKEIAAIGLLFLYQAVKNSEFADLSMLSEADQLLVSQVLNLNVEDIPSKFKFRARLSKVTDSQATKQQEALQLFQMYMAYGDKMSQIAAQMANPQMAQVPRVIETMQTYFVGLTNIMDKILVNFDEDNVKDYLPFIQDLQFALKQADIARSEEVTNLETSASGRAGSPAGPAGIQPQQGGGGVAGNVEGAVAPTVQGPQQVPQAGGGIGGPAI